MRVLLIHPDHPLDPTAYSTAGCWFCEPLALEYLAAGAKAAGHAARILDLRLHPQDLDRTVGDFTPDVVGITGYSQHVPRVQELAARCKAIAPGITTVVGGHHASVMPEDFQRPDVDHVVVGEGVGPLRRLLSQLEQNRRELVPGIWSRDGDSFHFGGETTHPPLDSLPLPDRTISRYDRPHYYMGDMKPIALLRTSVGCAFRCSFCALWKLMRGRYLVRSNDDVIRELGEIEEENIHLVDDEPWLDRRRMELLADAIAAAGIHKKYFVYCRVDTLINHEELLRKWHAIGLRYLFVGIEAVTPGELRRYNKGYSVAHVEKALDTAARLGLIPYSLLVLHPAYTKMEFERLQRFIRRRRVPNPSFTVWTPLPGTDQMPNFSGLTEMGADGRPNWYFWDLQHPVVPTRLPKEEFMRHVLQLRMANLGPFER